MTEYDYYVQGPEGILHGPVDEGQAVVIRDAMNRRHRFVAALSLWVGFLVGGMAADVGGIFWMVVGLCLAGGVLWSGLLTFGPRDTPRPKAGDGTTSGTTNWE